MAVRRKMPRTRLRAWAFSLTRSVGVDVARGHLLDVAGVLFLQFVGEGFKPPLDCCGGTGAAFGFVGQVEVFEFGEIGGGKYLFLQFGGHLALFIDGGQNGFAAFVQLFEADEEVADGCDLNFVETAGGLFPVAGYERDGGSLFEELDGFLHLTGAEIKLLGNGCGVIHSGKILNNCVIVM